jgi:hypothetical protein
MSSIPLPALSVKPPEDVVGGLQRILAIKSLLGQQQTQQLQQTALQQENQERALSLQDQQTLRSLAPNYIQKDSDGNVTGFDLNGLASDALTKGVNPSTVQAIQLQHAQAVSAMAGADEATRNNELAKNKAAYEALEGVRSIQDPQQKQATYQAAIPNLQKLGVDTSKLPAQVPGDDKLQDFETSLGAHAQILADAKTQADTAKAASDAKQADVDTALKQVTLNRIKNAKPGDFDAQIDSLAPPGGSFGTLNTQLKTMANGYLSRGDFEGAQKVLQDGFNQIGDINKETNPLVIQARAQAAAQTAQIVEPLRQSILSQFQNNKDARDKIEKDVLSPYQQKMSSITELQSALTQAQQGNVTAARGALLKLMGVTNPDGTKRYNEAEAGRMLSQGSIPQRVAGSIKNALTGNNWTPQMISDMQTFAQGQGQVASQTLNSGIDNVNSLYGTSVGGGLKKTPGVSAGMTRIRASDGSMHDVPSANLNAARKIDPGLQVVGGQ